MNATYPGASTFPGRGSSFGLQPDVSDSLGLTAVATTVGSLMSISPSLFSAAAVQPSAGTDPGATTFPGVPPGRGSQLPSAQPSIPTLAVTPV